MIRAINELNNKQNHTDAKVDKLSHRLEALEKENAEMKQKLRDAFM
jgi:peptidoglycan hydrolase CwlO-like protein